MKQIPLTFDKQTINNMLKSWREIRNQNNFMEKYQYIDWEKIKFLNKSTLFLSILSFYNISAPVLQLIAARFYFNSAFFCVKSNESYLLLGKRIL